MDGTEVRVFEQMYHECFAGFLESLYGLRLPAEGLAAGRDKRKGDFADETGEREFEEEEICGTLIAADLTQREGAGFVSPNFARSRFV